jgi:hypothetical protein
LRALVFTFLTRLGCHLCDQARPHVQEAVFRAGGVLEEIDIDSDDVLTRVYGLRIPVVLGPNGEVMAEGVIDVRRLRLTIKRAGRR